MAMSDSTRRAAIIAEWIECTSAAIIALEDWSQSLATWRAVALHKIHKSVSRDFDKAVQELMDSGLETWIGGEPVPGGLDLLATVVAGQPLPVLPTWDESILIQGAFGGEQANLELPGADVAAVAERGER